MEQHQGRSAIARNPRPVRRAYDQVADQVREWIMSGTLDVGDQLPSEGELAQQFRTSRSTVREALRLLASANLTETRPGAYGGTSVKRPDPVWVADSLHNSLTLLVRTDDVSVDELFAARELIEVPAAAPCGAEPV